jgi:hypothetical protein
MGEPRVPVAAAIGAPYEADAATSLVDICIGKCLARCRRPDFANVTSNNQSST